MKPYVICHTLSSIDGKILGNRWGNMSASLFEGPAKKIKVDAWIVGRVTMQNFRPSENTKSPVVTPSFQTARISLAITA